MKTPLAEMVLTFLVIAMALQALPLQARSPENANPGLKDRIAKLEAANRQLNKRLKRLEAVLQVSGNRAHISQLVVQENLEVGNNLVVGNRAQIGNTLQVENDLGVSRRLLVQGDTRLNGRAVIDGRLDVSQTIQAGGLNVSDQILLGQGASALKLDRTGVSGSSVRIQAGKNLTLKASGNIFIKSNGKISIKGRR